MNAPVQVVTTHCGMAQDPESVAQEMRSTLARLDGRGRAVADAHGRICDAALHRAEVVDSELAEHRAAAVQSADGLAMYTARLVERERLHRLAALRQ